MSRLLNREITEDSKRRTQALDALGGRRLRLRSAAKALLQSSNLRVTGSLLSSTSFWHLDALDHELARE